MVETGLNRLEIEIEEKPEYTNEAFEIEEPSENNREDGKQLPVPLPNTDIKADHEELRDNWENPSEFLMSCISMSVGLGNVWRFPFTAFNNGGGAFLIPYFIVLVLIGRPVYFLEMCLGQFSSYGQVKAWSFSPLFKGVGYGSMVGGICVVSFYCSIMAITVFYFFASFATTLPWAVCNADWGEEFCDINGTYIGSSNFSISQLYYEKTVFPQKENINDGIGTPEWRLTLCLLVSWVFIFLSLIKGVKSSGKVAYFTALFPYLVMIILLVRGLTLEGASKGILYFIKPQWDKIVTPQVWFAAISQCFFSLATGFGTVTMFASYNRFRHNIYRYSSAEFNEPISSSWVQRTDDAVTFMLAGCTIFAVLGNLSYVLGKDIRDVAKGGPSLAFISYPDAIAKFDWFPQLFSVLFFFMLFILGIGSATSLAGCFITIICDQFPKVVRMQVTCGVCFVGFLTGLVYVTPGGQFILTLVNYYGADFVIYIMAMFEVGVVAWVYGLNQFCRDIEFMLGIKVGWYWKICWSFIIPVGLFLILVYSVLTNEYITHEGVEYPTQAIVCGYIICTIALCFLPVCAIHTVWTRKATTLKEKFSLALLPSERWGPRNPSVKQEWEQFKQQ